MFALAIVIGIFGYYIFALGLIHALYAPLVLFGWILFVIAALSVGIYYYKKHTSTINKLLDVKKDPFAKILSLIFLITAGVYFIGTFVPEFAFDAVWYHLTLPKIYLQNHAIQHLPGGIFYYSDMPKLTEMIYTAVFANDIAAHIIHFTFGLLIVVSIFLLAVKYMSKSFALMACLIFYSNIIVGWESTTAYIDLARTFFEFLALFGFINFVKTKDRTWFVESAVMLGLAISTKLIAAGSLFIFVALIFSTTDWSLKEKLKVSITYSAVSLLIVSPWLVFSLLNTGNPIYPIFSGYGVKYDYLHVTKAILDIWTVFVSADNPISPIYLIVVPFIILMYKRMSQTMQLVSLYSLLAIIVWFVTPRTGGGRFMLPYLPAFSVIAAYVIYEQKDKLMKVGLIGLVIFLSLVTIGYRSTAELRYISYLTGQQSRSEFLIKHLNFNFGDFYDTDHYLQRKITSKDMVLTYGIHNLYYADFPFVESSSAHPGASFNYILVGDNTMLPTKYKNWRMIYSNQITHVKLYNFQGQTWIY